MYNLHIGVHIKVVFDLGTSTLCFGFVSLMGQMFVQFSTSRVCVVRVIWLVLLVLRLLLIERMFWNMCRFYISMANQIGHQTFPNLVMVIGSASVLVSLT